MTKVIAKMTKVIAIQQQERNQLLFGSTKAHVPHFKLQGYTQK